MRAVQISVVLVTCIMASTVSSKDSDTGQCEPDMLRANAIFVRSATYCEKNYMDSVAGRAALAASRACSASGDQRITDAFRQGMEQLDNIAKKNGAQAACRFVEKLEEAVLMDLEN